MERGWRLYHLVVCKLAFKRTNVLEIKHVSLDECLLDFLVGPADKELVVLIGTLRETCGER